MCLCRILLETQTWERAKVLLVKDLGVCHVVLKLQILFYLTIVIKLPGPVHHWGFSHSPFPYLDHVEFPERGSKLSSRATLSAPSRIPFTLRKKERRQGWMLSFKCKSSLKNTFITFWFFKGRTWIWRWSSNSLRVCVCVNMHSNVCQIHSFLRSRDCVALWGMKYVVDLLLTDKHGWGSRANMWRQFSEPRWFHLINMWCLFAADLPRTRCRH